MKKASAILKALCIAVYILAGVFTLTACRGSHGDDIVSPSPDSRIPSSAAVPSQQPPDAAPQTATESRAPQAATESRAPQAAAESHAPQATTESRAPQAAAESRAPRALPDGFVYVADAVPEVRVALKYAGDDNFTGAPVDGYASETAAILTREAAAALSGAAASLGEQGLGLLIYDAYRPQRAVDCFIRWTENDDTSRKADYYPDLDKSELPGVYIGRKSGHSRGSTVDLTLVTLDDGEPLDMGGDFDFLDPVSAHGAPGLTEEQADNRAKLKNAMEACGFRAYNVEWWHYTLANEPFPHTYFDFIVA
jgi:D-alanyl-D-alanine dipeptidase